LRQLNWRYATKRFDPAKKIDPLTWAALEETLILSPSSFGLQPWRFCVINDFLENPPYALDIRAWSSRQVYIALGNFMTCAALLGVDTCPMEGLDPAGYDKALGLEGSGFWTVAACPAGSRAETDKHSALPTVRFEKQEIITYIP